MSYRPSVVKKKDEARITVKEQTFIHYPGTLQRRLGIVN